MRIWVLSLLILGGGTSSFMPPDLFLRWEAEEKMQSLLPQTHIQASGMSEPIRTLIIDPGHGGKDPGSVGKVKYEKDITLGVALKLKQELQAHMPEVKVVLTRETDTFISLYQRGEIAQRNQGDFFLSIHCNGLANQHSHGTETYVLGTNRGEENFERIIKENQAILFEDHYADYYGGYDPSSPEADILFSLTNNALRGESMLMAEMVQGQYALQSGRLDRGVKQAPFVVLYMCGMPAVLTEIGFITHPQEEAFLMSEEGQAEIAKGLFKAIANYNVAYR